MGNMLNISWSGHSYKALDYIHPLPLESTNWNKDSDAIGDTVVDKVHPLLAKVLREGSAPKQDNVPWHITSIHQERLEECNKELKASTGSQNLWDSNLIKYMEWTGTSPIYWGPNHQHTGSKGSTKTSWCQTLQNTPKGLMTMPWHVTPVFATQKGTCTLWSRWF